MQQTDDTIAAIATPLGEGGLGVVRMSGPRALEAADAFFHFPQKLAGVPSHTIHMGRVVAPEGAVDQAVAAVFRAPHSYTGEDVVEISCHGGPAILKRVLALCLSAGARLAAPGEFTQRAFLNGKMDLAQAEAVAELIQARSERFSRLAFQQLDGRLSRHLQTIRQPLVDLVAQLEANLDFVEDEVPPLNQAELARRIAAIADKTRALVATAPQGQVFRDGLRVAIVGKPNVGKSSLFNALLGTERAIVTHIPGTTRDTLEERITVDGISIILTDTAGLRKTPDVVESFGIGRARQTVRAADAVLFVTDASSPLGLEDGQAAEEIKGQKGVWARNKSDKRESYPEGEQIIRKFVPDFPVVDVSALTGEGLGELKRLLLVPFLGQTVSKDESPVPTLIHVRHVALLENALAALERAGAAAQRETVEECVALDLRQALQNISEITGEKVSDDILNAIFSRFCIGK